MNTGIGFWRRQFLLPPTRPQTFCDLVFGILLPLGCLAADQVLFGRTPLADDSHSLFVGSVFGNMAVLAYTFIGTEVALLAFWMLLRRKIARSSAFFAGPLLAGCLFSLVVAVFLLVPSLIGLVIIIGALGLCPWLTCFSYYRNWKLARTLARGSGSTGRTFWFSLAGMVFAITPALALQTLMEHGWVRLW